MLRSQNVRKMFKNDHNESSYPKKYSAKWDSGFRIKINMHDSAQFKTKGHYYFCLFFVDASGITNKAAVTQLQCQVLEALRKYTSYAYPNDARRYGKILLRLPTLRLVSAKAAERFLSMTLDGTIRMNALVKEMFN